MLQIFLWEEPYGVRDASESGEGVWVEQESIAAAILKVLDHLP
jgi:hypothetical protein